MINPSRFYAMLSCLFLLSIPFSANAALVTFNFSGTINTNHGLASDLHSIAPIGTVFTGSYTFDTAAPATTVRSPNDISYVGAITAFTINFGSSFLNVDNGAIRVRNEIPRSPDFDEESPVFQDDYSANTVSGAASLPINIDTNIVLSNYVSTDLDSAWHFKSMRISVTDLTANMFSDAALSSTPPNFTPNTGFTFEYQLDCCTGTTRVGGHLDSLTVSAIPLPAAFWLFTTGLLSLMRVAMCTNTVKSVQQNKPD